MVGDWQLVGRVECEYFAYSLEKFPTECRPKRQLTKPDFCHLFIQFCQSLDYRLLPSRPPGMYALRGNERWVFSQEREEKKLFVHSSRQPESQRTVIG